MGVVLQSSLDLFVRSTNPFLPALPTFQPLRMNLMMMFPSNTRPLALTRRECDGTFTQNQLISPL